MVPQGSFDEVTESGAIVGQLAITLYILTPKVLRVGVSRRLVDPSGITRQSRNYNADFADTL
jgi:hypothetical protein